MNIERRTPEKRTEKEASVASTIRTSVLDPQIKRHSPSRSPSKGRLSDFETNRTRPAVMTSWPDRRLIAAICEDRPNIEALDELANRYWKPVFGRCRLLTLDAQKAASLAQAAWQQALRHGRELNRDEGFATQVVRMATRMWHEMNVPDESRPSATEIEAVGLPTINLGEIGETAPPPDLLPDLDALTLADRSVLEGNIDRALAWLTPRLRSVLLAHFIDGETPAEIGRRYDCSEPTAEAWLGQGLEEMRRRLGNTLDRWDAREGGCIRSSSHFTQT